MAEISPLFLLLLVPRSLYLCFKTSMWLLYSLVQLIMWLLYKLLQLIMWPLYKLVQLVLLVISTFHNRLGAVELIIFYLLLLFLLYYYLKASSKDVRPLDLSWRRQREDSPWKREHSIGDGGFGIVYVEHNRITGDKRAVKELKNIANAESLRKEIKILCRLKHPNIVKYYHHKEDGHKISLYMEFIEQGSLKKYISKHDTLHETLIREFTAQILAALVYLRRKRVVHRDLKPDNILVDSQDNIKLVDFGVSKYLAESVGMHSMLGTPYYAAPEVLAETPYKNSDEASAADIWSLGCIIIEMFSRKHPWPDCKDTLQIFRRVVDERKCPRIPDELCREGKKFLKRCFIRTPADRPSAAELLDDPFVKPQNLSC